MPEALWIELNKLVNSASLLDDQNLQNLIEKAIQNKSTQGLTAAAGKVTSKGKIVPGQTIDTTALKEITDRLNIFIDAVNDAMGLIQNFGGKKQTSKVGKPIATADVNIQSKITNLKNTLTSLSKAKSTRGIANNIASSIQGSIASILGDFMELLGPIAAEKAIVRAFKNDPNVKVTSEFTGTEGQIHGGNKRDVSFTIDSTGNGTITINLSAKGWVKGEQAWMRSYGRHAIKTGGFGDLLRRESPATQYCFANEIIHGQRHVTAKNGKTTFAQRYLARKHMIDFIGKDIDLMVYTNGYQMIDDFYKEVYMHPDQWFLGLEYDKGSLENKFIEQKSSKMSVATLAWQRSHQLATNLYSSQARLLN